jgi:hypothetical protein
MYKIKRAIIKFLIRNKTTAVFVALYYVYKSYLKPKGWYKSRFSLIPSDAEGNPIPWFTYSSIYFIEQKLNAKLNVLEFGSGNSTMWFATRVKKIISVESNPEFYNKIKKQLNSYSNVDYRLATLGKDYYQQMLSFKKEFDIIIIDGRERVQCAYNSLDALKKDGIIIWDNSDRLKYTEGYNFLTDNGFKKIDFHGHGPIGASEWKTTIYYRQDNCFNI